MGMHLVIHVQGAEPYPIDDPSDLINAIAEEAEKVAAGAGGDLLDDPGPEAREQLCERVQDEALRVLGSGSPYRDPTGVRWSLVDAD